MPTADQDQPDLLVYVDGAARSNPVGPAAIGVSVRSTDGRELDAVGELIGQATNNEAEYRAVIKGLELAAKRTSGNVHICSDSQVTIRQLNGDYKTREPRLAALQALVRATQSGFAKVGFLWVPREDPGSQRADALANAALAEAGHPKKEWEAKEPR